MPTYEYKCKNCNTIFERLLPISKRNTPEKDICEICGTRNIEMKIGCPAICDPVRIGTKKPDKGFQEVLQKIKKNHPKNNIRNRW